MPWVLAAKLDDIPEDDVIGCEVAGEQIALFRLDGVVYATHAICTHQVANLAEGFVEDDCVECPLHQGRFHIPTGKAMGTPVTEDLRTYEVKLEGSEVFVCLPE